MRVGVIGHGAIGSYLVDHIVSTDGLELSFVLTRTPVADVPWPATSELTEELLDGTDLVIEAAHPDIIATYGEQILSHADLMVVSAGGLVDDVRREQLVASARKHGRRIVVPYGALTGLESLAGRPSAWRSATITFVKPPQAFEPAPSDVRNSSVLYDGPVRGVAARYPRNVNAMVTFALATVGLDEARAVLVSDPSQSFATLDFTVTGKDGGTLHVTKNQPLIGVSGSEMPDAIVHSLRMHAGGRPGLWFG
ncbi:aspartate dehydrogenase domain-containing protein [Lysobacter korlensis]|uniref:Aspartate dehydrogenase domain-containing protein n=1 Tax=Lysobacter korlensis TaxID=553636 RepID=A0ABV6RVX9_9GAMM